MRGPHNIFRLIRTGATFERTGAMNVILNAYQAPVGLRLAAKILGWPFQWLGYKGDPAMPPVTRALTALGPAYIKFGQILSTAPMWSAMSWPYNCGCCKINYRPFRSKRRKK